MYRNSRAKEVRLDGGIQALRSHKVFYFFASISAPIFAAVAIPMLTSKGSASQVGVISVLWGIITFVTNFDFGIGRMIGKRASLRRSKVQVSRRPDVEIGIIIQFLIGIVLSLCGIIYIAFVGTHSRTILDDVLLVSVGAVSVPFVLAMAGARFALEGDERFISSSIIGLLNTLTTYLLPAVMIYFGYSLRVSVITMLASKIILSTLSVFGAVDCTRVRDTGSEELLALSISFVRTGGWLSAASILALVATYADKFVMSNALRPEEVLKYTVPFEIVSKMGVLNVIAARILAPGIYDKSGDIGQLKISLVMSYRAALVLSVCFCLASLFLPNVLEILVGPQYDPEMSEVSLFIMMTVSASAFGMVATNALIALDNTRSIAISTLIGIVLFYPFSIYYIYSGQIVMVAAVWAMRSIMEITFCMIVVLRKLNLRLVDSAVWQIGLLLAFYLVLWFTLRG